MSNGSQHLPSTGLGSFYDRHCLSLSLNKKAWRKEDQEDYGKTEEEEREEAEEYKDKPYTVRLKVSSPVSWPLLFLSHVLLLTPV